MPSTVVPWTPTSSTTVTTAPTTTTTVVPAGDPMRVAGATAICVMSLIALFLNCLLQFIFVKHWNQYRRSSFLIISWQLVICDTGSLIMQLVLAVPITYTAKNLYGTGALIYSLTVIDTLSYYGTLLFAFLMALNRTMTFFLQKVNKRLFDVPNIYGTIAITWLLITITPISLYASGCFKIFDISAVYLQVFCQSSAVTYGIRKFWNYVKQGIPVAVLIMYVAIFFYVYYSTRKALATTKFNGKAGGGIKSKERSIILQSFLIVGVLEARDWILHGLPLIIQDSRGTIYLNVAHECSYILSSSLTAIVVLMWNKEIRARWISLLCCRSLRARIGPSILVNSTFSHPSGASKNR